MQLRIKALVHALVASFGLAYMNASAQMAQPLVGENATKVSEHVWAIMGFPNVAI